MASVARPGPERPRPSAADRPTPRLARPSAPAVAPVARAGAAPRLLRPGHAAPLPARVPAPLTERPIRRPTPGVRPSPPLAAVALPRLLARAGAVRTPAGRALRLIGAEFEADALQQAKTAPAWLDAVAPGQRCVAIHLGLARHCEPALLRLLDAWIARQAEQGSYTLLLLAARLWRNQRRLAALAARHADAPHVHLGLLGRGPLAGPVWQAAMALQREHPGLFVWLPLECAHAAPTHAAAASIGWLWDAATPQRPALTAGLALAYPLLLRGWRPDAQSTLALHRLMALCREAAIGWLAAASAPEPALRLAAHLSAADAPHGNVRAAHAIQSFTIRE